MANIEFFELAQGKESDKEIQDFFSKHKIIKWETVTRISSPSLLVVEYE